MNELVAKPIVKNQFWIVTDGNKKVGNIEANSAGYNVQINGSFLQFDSTEDIQKVAKITFEASSSVSTRVNRPYPEYPTPDKVYNSVVDITKGLHLFTMSPESKCLHAAGYFVIDQNGEKTVIFCPKFIFVQRYSYEGPFKTEDEAMERLNIT